MSTKEKVIKELKGGLNLGEALLAEYLFGMTGSFYNGLFQTAMAADNENFMKLAMGFPEEMEALKRYKYENGYWEDLQLRYKRSSQSKVIDRMKMLDALAKLR